MSITIGSNIASLQAQRRLAKSADQLGAVYERLSSGQRINRASDDAAGLAISESLRTDARVFTQAVRNLTDGASYLVIAEAAVSELKGIITRQKELAQQSANGIYSDDQRVALETEFQAISAEFNRIIASTSFNQRKLFSSENGSLSIQVGYGEEGVLFAEFGSGVNDEQTEIERSSINGAVQTNNNSLYTDVSEDGRYVVFMSNATNLVEGDTNATSDIFLRDNLTGIVKRVSVSSTGEQGNGQSNVPTISADGRYVAFYSYATNLVDGDTEGRIDIFVHDTLTAETKRISTASDGTAGDSNSYNPSISADGRYVAFHSFATNLVVGDTNGVEDIFVHDTLTGETERVNLRSVGGQANVRGRYASISGDGRYVVWESEDGNLVAGDTNARVDVFMHDRLLNQTQLISANSSGTIGNGTSWQVDISDNGRYVAFCSAANNLVSGDINGFSDIIVHDIVTGEKKIVSLTSDGTQANFTNNHPKISGDGRYVVWESDATNFSTGDTNSQLDIFVHDTKTGQTERVSSNTAGIIGDNRSDTAAVSGDGRYILFESQASNLVSGDTNGMNDIFFAGNPTIGLTEIGRNQWLKIDTQEEALLSLSRLSSYLDELNQVAGDIGAVLSRFQVATGNLNSMKENCNRSGGSENRPIKKVIITGI